MTLWRLAGASLLVAAALLISSHSALAQFTQQGPKLVGSGTVVAAGQGLSIALSADGNTAIVGGPLDNGGTGAAWVHTRSGGVWSQQGNKLVGTGAVGMANPRQGQSVALSADGNTAIVGGVIDNDGLGAAWVFTRSGGMWSQQGAKLVGTGAVGNAEQGSSVALSADGNTALVGGLDDNGFIGAVWVFTRNGGVWSQQGGKLAGSDAVGAAEQGVSAALSADGNTAIVGGYNDNTGVGAAWVYIRNGGVWSQQGAKLTGTGAAGQAKQGQSVALSADGNTAIVGGDVDNGNVGAAWVYTRSGGVWSQQGAKLTGTNAIGVAHQGTSVALSASGNMAIVGGYGDNGLIGAAWVYTRSGGVWTQLGNKLVGTGSFGQAKQGQSVALSADGTTAIVGGYGDTGSTGASWVYVQAPTSIISSILPASRSVQVGVAATAFNTTINTGSAVGTACGLALGTSIPATFSYQTTDPATNQLTGTANTPATIAANNGIQSYVFSITPTAAFSAADVTISPSCANANPGPVVTGLNTLLLSASTTPVPDVVALAASIDPGYVDLPGAKGTGAFAVASVNVGASGAITVSADTGSAALPVTITLCQTNSNSACTNPATPASSVNLTINANATPTFSIFVTGSGAVTNDPANNRVFVRFKDGGGVTRGSTSVAVKTQ